jgi:hypothetical protein
VPDDKIENKITSQIQVSKNRDYPELPTIDCSFDVETFTFAEVVNKKIMQKSSTGWKKFLKPNLKINDGQENHAAYERSVNNG